MALLNLDFIKDNVSDEPEFITELLQVFKQDVFKDFETVQRSIQNSDFQSIRADAHKVKSSLRSICLDECWKRLQEAEDLGKSATGLDRIIQLSLEINALMPELKKEVGTYLLKPH